MKQYKIYTKGYYIVIVDVQKNEYFYGIRKEVHIDKSNVNKAIYRAFNVKDFSSSIILAVPNILKEDGTPYSEAEFDTFYQENTGNFNGGGTAPVETDPVFSASEAASFVAGDKANLDNQSGINSGDETTLSIQTKRPLKTVNNESLEGTGNIQIDYNDLDNLPAIPTLLSNHSELSLDDGTNPHGTTKGDVGLSNVDNTSDIDKPISTATQTALSTKLDKSTTPSSVYTTDARGLQVMKPLSDFGGGVSTDSFNSLLLGTDSQLYKEIEFGTAQRNAGVCESMGYGFNTLAISQLRTAPTLAAGTFTIFSSTDAIFNLNRKYGIVSSTTAGTVIGLNPGQEYAFYRQLGFYYSIKFGIADSVIVNTSRTTVGVTNNSSSVANVDPSTLINCILFANDSADNNMQIMHNDNIGVCTKIDLGSDFPAKSTGVWYSFELFGKPNENIVYYRVTNLSSNIIATGALTTDIPSQSTPIGMHFKRGNGADGGAIRFGFGQTIRSY